MRLLPATPPRLSVVEVLARLHRAGYEINPGEVILVGIRGYRHDDHADNERGIYDDAAFILGGHSHFSSYSFNTDPSVFSQGVATLALGEHRYRPGFHRKGAPSGHPAFRPATPGEELPVTRDGVVIPWPGVALNIHRGARNGTSSLGCQTLHPDHWDSFHATMMDQLKRAGQEIFRYILIQ